MKNQRAARSQGALTDPTAEKLCDSFLCNDGRRCVLSPEQHALRKLEVLDRLSAAIEGWEAEYLVLCSITNGMQHLAHCLACRDWDGRADTNTIVSVTRMAGHEADIPKTVHARRCGPSYVCLPLHLSIHDAPPLPAVPFDDNLAFALGRRRNTSSHALPAREVRGAAAAEAGLF